MEPLIFALFGFGALTYALSGAFGDTDEETEDPEIEGTAGDDHLETADLSEIDERYQISMNGGNDTVIGSRFIDASIDGGSGDDELRTRGNDFASGGAGSDLLEGTDNSTISGGEGSDTLYVFDAANAFGGNGSDLLSVYDAEAGTVVDAGEGDDSVLLLSGEEGSGELPSITLGEGQDSVILSPDLFSSSGQDQSVLIEDFNPDEDELVVDVLREGRFTPEIVEHLKSIDLVESEDGSYTDVITSFGPPGLDHVVNSFRIRLAGVSDFTLLDISLIRDVEASLDELAETERFSGMIDDQEIGTGAHRYVVMTDSDLRSEDLPPSALTFLTSSEQPISVELSSDTSLSLVHMGVGNDSVNVTSGSGSAFGGAGDDTLNSSLSNGAVVLDGGQGNDIAIMRMGHQFRGGEGDDDVFLLLEPEDLEEGQPAIIGGIGQGEITVSYSGASEGDLSLLDDENSSTNDLRVVDIFVQDQLVAKLYERRTRTGVDEVPVSERIILLDR